MTEFNGEMFDPTDISLDLILDSHLERLSDEDKHGMLMEFFSTIRDYVTIEGTSDEAALSQCVYASHLFIRIFEELYTKAEAVVEQQEHLRNCFNK